MFFRSLIFFSFLFFSQTALSQSLSENDISLYSQNEAFKTAEKLFTQGHYEATLKELNAIEKKLVEKGASRGNLALLAYWKGIVASRLNDFPEAIKSFKQGLKLGHKSQDIHYELGQALFASEKMKSARSHFAKSYRRKYKRAVSLYYIGFISKEIRDYKKAYKYFKAIEKLPPEESKEVLQASRMQIGDMYQAKAEDHPDSFRMLEHHVIPQFERALEVDPHSNLGSIIKDKITEIQKRYDLVLFQLRNGRPVLRPPYFLKVSQEVGYDSNVIFNPNDTTISRAKQSSEFTQTDIFGRYTFYYHDYFSFSPELRFNNTYHFNREPEIYRNDSRSYSAALRNAYEDDFMGRPASFLFDIDYNEVHRDINQKKKVQFNSSALGFMIGERLNFWDRGDTVARLRYQTYDSVSDISDSQTISLSLEQIVTFTQDTLLLYTSIDRTRVEFDFFDTNSVTLRADYIFSRFREWVTPIIGLGLTRVDPINDRSIRGIETFLNPTVRLIKNFGKNWRFIGKYDKHDYDSKDPIFFAYQKEIYSLELEYLF